MDTLRTKLDQELKAIITLNSIYWGRTFHSVADMATYVRRVERLAKVREELKKLEATPYRPQASNGP
jgi:hypothetical protein